jgi:hypothetical protein
MTVNKMRKLGQRAVKNRIRTLEAVALLATVAAFGLTAVLEPAGAARESNGVASRMLSTFGWAPVGVLAVVVEGAIFAGYRRVDLAGYRRTAVAGGGLVAAVGIADIAWNVYVLAEVGVPETVRAGKYGLAVAVVAASAALVFYSSRVGALARSTVSASRDVTSRLSKPGLSSVRAALLVVVLVVAAISGVVTLGPLPASDTASATTTIDISGQTKYGTGLAQKGDRFYVLDNNEPEIIVYDSDWNHVTTHSINSGNVKGLAYSSGYFYVTDESNNDMRVINATDFSQVASVNMDDQQKGTLWGGPDYVYQTVPSGVRKFNATTNPQVIYNESSTDDGMDISAGRYRSESGTHFITNGSYVQEYTQSAGDNFTSGSRSYNVSTDTYEMVIGPDGNIYSAGSLFTSVTQTNITLGYKVDGTVTDADGNTIDSATVELRQSGSVTKSASTNSSGGYSFSGVSNGDYTVRASGDGYQNKSKSITVSGSPRTVDLSLYESGTFSREFQLGETASQTYPPSMSTLKVYRFDRAIEFPIPGGYEFKAGPGTWKKVDSTAFNGYGTATSRLENGEPYRVEVVATSGDRSTRWENLGWVADKSRADPFLITVGDSDDSTPTATSTGTSTATVSGAGGGGTSYPGLNPPCDPFDLDDDGDLMSCPDGDGTDGPGSTVTYSESDGYGPRVVGACIVGDGSSGVLVEYWDPSYSTTSLDYNLSHGNSSYAGNREFSTPVGYDTWCIADTLTGNASDSPGETTLSGNYTQGGEAFNYSDTLDSQSFFAAGGPVGGGGGGGASGGQQAVGLGVLVAGGYLVARRTTDFRVTEAAGAAASAVAKRIPGGGR